jgi:hypothetical protein
MLLHSQIRIIRGYISLSNPLHFSSVWLHFSRVYSSAWFFSPKVGHRKLKNLVTADRQQPTPDNQELAATNDNNYPTIIEPTDTNQPTTTFYNLQQPTTDARRQTKGNTKNHETALSEFRIRPCFG